MRIEYHHKGKKVKHHEWPDDMWYLILGVCQDYIVVQEPDGNKKVIERNDADKGWEFV